MPKFTKISADEAHDHRKDVTNDEGVMAKGVPVTPDVVRAPKFDAEKRSARFVMSAEVPDRMGDVVHQEGLDTTNFEANPQALLFHNSRSWPIGRWADVEKNLNGRPRRTEGTMILLAQGEDPDADRAARHIAAGTMRTVSIGFRPDWDAVEAIRDDDGHFTGLRFLAAELLECSLVPIPALPAATMKELTTGMLSPESLELIKGVLENFELKDGEVLNREHLEERVREAEGNKTTHLIDLREIPVATGFRKEADGTITIIGKASDTPPAPKDGEQVPVQPEPADGERQKTIDAVAIVREHARESKEPGLFARLLGKIMPKDAGPDPVEHETPPDPEPAPVKMTDEEKAALKERASKTIQAATTKVAELEPA